MVSDVIGIDYGGTEGEGGGGRSGGDGEDLTHVYCEEINVFNCEEEAINLRRTFEDLMECDTEGDIGNGGGSGSRGERTGFWNFDAFSFNRLMNLSICCVKLKDIKFIGCCTLLKTLNLSFNKIRDISPVAALTQLVQLDISHNKVIELTPLKGLCQLQILRFHKNNVQCIESLNSMTQLNELWMSNNEIQWTEFLHLSKLTSVTHIIMEKNTCEEKPKYLEFLLAICPSVLTVNGLPAINSMPKVSQMDNKSWYNPSDFLKTSDGRVMLTQAKALLNESQREFLGTKAIGDTSVRRNLLLENTTMESPIKLAGRRGSLDSNSIALSQELMTSPLNQTQIRSTRSEGGDPIKYYKAKRQKNAPKKYIQEYDKELRDSIEQTKISEQQGFLETRSAVNEESGGGTAVSKSSFDLERERAQLIEAPVTLIRFGETSSAAVALSLHQDGTGFSR
jgi:hypothetical protein